MLILLLAAVYPKAFKETVPNWMNSVNAEMQKAHCKARLFSS